MESETPTREYVSSDIELACVAVGGPCLPGVRKQPLAQGYLTRVPPSTSHYSQGVTTPWAGGLVDPSEGIKTSFPCL